MTVEIELIAGAIPSQDAWLRGQGSGDAGAVVEFRGVVRATEGDATIPGIFYEAYSPMAEALMRQHLEHLCAESGVLAAKVIHRTGWVPVAECSIWMGVASPHRREALDVVADFLDVLKTDVPIWKAQFIPPAPPPEEPGTFAR